VTAASLLASLRVRGFRLQRVGPALHVAPRAALTDDDRVVIHEHLAELKALVATEGPAAPAVTVPRQPPRSTLVTHDTLESAIAAVTAAREIVLDVETDGLEPFLAGHRLIGLAILAGRDEPARVRPRARTGGSREARRRSAPPRPPVAPEEFRGQHGDARLALGQQGHGPEPLGALRPERMRGEHPSRGLVLRRGRLVEKLGGDCRSGIRVRDGGGWTGWKSAGRFFTRGVRRVRARAAC
jgi:hypothetical protein